MEIKYNMNKKAALIEISTAHDECLYSQLSFLKDSGYEVDLICSSVLRNKIPVIASGFTSTFFSFGKNVISDIRNLLSLRKFLIRKKINKVIFNSADGIRIRNFLLLSFPKEIEFAGILHDSEKVIRSGNQKFINKKVKKYFVLSDYVLNYALSLKLEKQRFESFYAIFQPEYSPIKISKPHDEFWVCIPGRVEQKRRDYDQLLMSLSQTRLNEKVKIILLGTPDEKFKPQLKEKINKLNLAKQFILFEEFLDNETFYSYLKLSDIVLPLIHPSAAWFNKYFRTQISGSYIMAYTYKIPLLCEKSFSVYEDFNDTSFFYVVDNLIESINELASNRNHFIEKRNTLYKLPKWNYDFQRDRYIKFLES
jgi:hypothetical protein